MSNSHEINKLFSKIPEKYGLTQDQAAELCMKVCWCMDWPAFDEECDYDDENFEKKQLAACKKWLF